jgi:indole-3-glycerol phosphate synthase
MMFFEPGNIDDLSRCIVELYNNSLLRKDFVDNSFQIYEKIQWGITKKAYIKAITGLCPI